MSPKAQPVSFADALAAHRKHPGNYCGMKLALDAMPADLATQVRAALTDRSVSASAIVAALKDVGHPATRHSVERHRRNDCQCG